MVAKNKSAHKPTMFTRRGLADALDVHIQTVTGWEQQGMPVLQRGGPGRPSFYSLPQVWQWRLDCEIAARGVAGVGVLSPHNERALLDRARREDIEQKKQVREGQLVSAEAVERGYADVAIRVMTRLRGIPAAVADQVVSLARQGPAAVSDHLLTHIDTALLDLSRGVVIPAAEELVEDEGGPGDGTPDTAHGAAS